MIGNIWVSSAIAITLVFTASVSYKAYEDIQSAKNIQQSFELITEIKELISKQYNKDPSQITRDEIIAFLPKGKNWEKILLSNRRSGNIHNDSLLNENAEFIIDENEKIKLLALKAKLKEYGMQTSTTQNGSEINFQIGMTNKNSLHEDEIVQNRVEKTIELISLAMQNSNSKSSIVEMIENNTPYSVIYQDMKNLDSESLTQSQLKERKEAYFKNRIKQKLLSSKNSRDMKIYNELKDEL